MRKMTSAEKALKNELAQRISLCSTKELFLECAHAAVPDKKEAVIAGIGELVVVGISAVSGMDFVHGVATVVGTTLTYAGVRSGIEARNEWAELGRRAYGSVKGVFSSSSKEKQQERIETLQQILNNPAQKVTELKDDNGVLAAQAAALQGRRI